MSQLALFQPPSAPKPRTYGDLARELGVSLAEAIHIHHAPWREAQARKRQRKVKP